MKTSDIGLILNAFFQDNGYKAILIDGKWGIGKTYQLKNYFDSLKRKDKKRVFYFTIFGTESIDELNTKIYRTIHPIWSKFLIGYKTISQSVDAVVGLKNSSLNISHNLDYVLDLVSPEKIKKNPILIFDDIERFSNKIFHLFLGQLYKLNLQGARIICIVSSEKLNEKRKCFNEYKEKIFDAIYKIDEPSYDIFESIFSEIKGFDYQSYIFSKCNNNIRILRKASLLYYKIIYKIGKKENWIIDPLTVIIACCYVIQIVLTQIPGNAKKDSNSYIYFDACEEFGDDIALNYINVLEMNKNSNDSLSNIFPSIIKSILRIYLFDDYESIKSLILKQNKSKTSLLDQTFFYLSDENKEKYANSFATLIADSNTKYDKRYLDIFTQIIRYYPKVDQTFVENLVIKYFSSCKENEIDNTNEIEFYLIELRNDISNIDAKQRLELVITIVKNKLVELQTKYHTSKLIEAITYKNSFVVGTYIERFNHLSKLIDKNKVCDLLINNNFFLPNLAIDISKEEWHFSHQIAELVHLLQIDDSFINYAKSLVINNSSRSLKERLEALIFYKLEKQVVLIK